MTGYYGWDDHELYNLPHSIQNRSKKNALVHMSSSDPGVQTCHVPHHVPLYIFSFPIVRILKFKHLHSISPLRSCPTTPNLGQARHGNNQTPCMQCSICRLCSAQLKMTPEIPPFRREFVRLLEIFSATLRRRS